MSRPSPDTAHRLAFGKQHDSAHVVESAVGSVVENFDLWYLAFLTEHLENKVFGVVDAAQWTVAHWPIYNPVAG